MLEAAFSGKGARPQWIPNRAILGLSPFWVELGAFREAQLKPLVYGLGAAVLLLLGGLGLRLLLARRLGMRPGKAALLAGLGSAAGLLVLGGLAFSPEWLSYVTLRRFTLDANHAWVSLLCLALAIATALLTPARAGWRRTLLRAGAAATWAGAAVVAISGVFMFVKIEALAGLTRLAYTGLEVGLALALVASALALLVRLLDTRPVAEEG